MTTDLHEALALAVARAKYELDNALKTHAAAVARVQQIAARASETEQRRQEITTARLSGKINAGEAAELHAMSLDAEALARLHIAAQADADSHAPAVEAARTALAAAEDQWQRNIDEARYAALLAVTREHESALLKVVAATIAAGKKLGHVRPRQSWMPTDRLARCVINGTA
jgi:hypothetical protein